MENVRYVDDAFPGFVECRLTDTSGRAWLFTEKVPVVTTEDLDPNSDYPRPVIVACVIVARRLDAAGSELVTIDTGTPWGVEAAGGETRFEVRAEQVVELD